MTVILVLSTFVLFLLIDHFFSKKPAVVMATKPVRAANPPFQKLGCNHKW